MCHMLVNHIIYNNQCYSISPLFCNIKMILHIEKLLFQVKDYQANATHPILRIHTGVPTYFTRNNYMYTLITLEIKSNVLAVRNQLTASYSYKMVYKE